jgi:hypothetical protein
MANNDGKEITRRAFVRQAGGALLAASSAGMTARSYARVLGANDRIRLGQLGCGQRSRGHVHMVSMASKQMAVEAVLAALSYPKGFLYTYKTTFGNSYRSFSRIQGRNGTIINYGGEGASLFVVTKEGGADDEERWMRSMRAMYLAWRKQGAKQGAREAFLQRLGQTPFYYTQVPAMGPSEEEAEIVRVQGAPEPNSLGPGDDDVTHLMNWLRAHARPQATQCQRGSRFFSRPNVHHGGPVLPEREKALLGCRGRRDRGESCQPSAISFQLSLVAQTALFGLRLLGHSKNRGPRDGVRATRLLRRGTYEANN